MKNFPLLAFLGAGACFGAVLLQSARAESDFDFQSTREVVAEETIQTQNWRFEMGPLFRTNMRVGFGGSSYSQALVRSGPPSLPQGIGSATGYADRTYSDGYVKSDAGTGNPSSVGGPNATWFWGYNNASQYNAAAQTLSFHSSGAYGLIANDSGLGSSQTDNDSAGFEMEVAGTLASNCWLKLDFTVGAEAVWGNQNSWTTSDFNGTSSRIDVTDVYTTSGIATVPAAGYRGTSAGPLGNTSSTGSPLISDLPSSRQVNIVNLGAATNTIDLKTRADVFELWLGPRLLVQPTGAVSCYVNPKVGGAFVNVRADRTENLFATSSTLQTWDDSAREKKCTFMSGVSGGVNLKVYGTAYIDLHGGYEWSGSNVNFQVGPNSVSFNPSGWTVGISVGMPIDPSYF